MANNFSNYLYNVTSSLATFYTAPAGTTTVVIGCQASNKSNTGTVSVTLAVTSGAQTENLVKAVSIPTNASLGLISGKLVLEAGDVLKAQTGTTGDVAIILSVLEIS